MIVLFNQFQLSETLFVIQCLSTLIFYGHMMHSLHSLTFYYQPGNIRIYEDLCILELLPHSIINSELVIHFYILIMTQMLLDECPDVMKMK